MLLCYGKKFFHNYSHKDLYLTYVEVAIQFQVISMLKGGMKGDNSKDKISEAKDVYSRACVRVCVCVCVCVY